MIQTYATKVGYVLSNIPISLFYVPKRAGVREEDQGSTRALATALLH